MNKRLLVSSLFFTGISLIATSSLAEEIQKLPPKASFLKTVDKNADGKASKAEFFAAMEKKFHSMDVDKSDVVSVQELKLYGEKDEAAKKQAQQAAKVKTEAAVLQTLSEEAFTKRFTDRAELEFAGLDKNHDNQLSADELGTGKAQQEKKPKNKPANQKKDSKDDFMVWIAESAEQNFFQLDKNYDGELSNDELSVLASELKSVLPELKSNSAMSTIAFDAQTTEKKKLIKSFSGVDVNNDGKINSKEKKTLFDGVFNHLDMNHDHKLSVEELQAGNAKQKKNPQNVLKEDFIAWFTESAEQKFFQLDDNYDGELSNDELGMPVSALLPKLKPVSLEPDSETSKNDSDDKESEQQKLIKPFFVGIDANNDGQISNKEKIAAFERLFNRMDTNHDQFITSDEIIAGRHTPAPDNP